MLQLMQLASTQLQNYPNYLGSRIGELVLGLGNWYPNYKIAPSSGKDDVKRTAT
jgi:hypothetical protein